MLGIVQIDSDGRIAAHVVFDPDDIDAAFEELDARYLAGEAAAYSRTWSVIAQTYATFNRRELPPTTPDWVNIDHRRATSFAPGDTTAYLRATWDVAPNINIYIEAVHRLSDVGGVITHAAHGTSQEGFDAEWREITVFTVDGDLINRAEIFDGAEIDAALAQFDELSRPAPRLENAASRVDDRFETYFAARNWDAMTEAMADDISVDDRRRVVNAGLRRGRDVEIESMRATADLGVREVISSVIAIRGKRLALSRNQFMGRDRRPEAFRSEVLCIIEIDADERILARVTFDIDDIDAAFKELDARYVAGEAAAHAQTWSVILGGYAALNRHEVPPTTPGWINIDHRRGIAFAPGDMIPYIRATFDVAPDVSVHVEAVHRLSNIGAIVTHAAYGSSPEGFNAEWREIALLTVQGDRVNRCEMFDDDDLDNALARFDELNQRVPQLENAATRARRRVADAFNRRDLAGFLALHDGRYEDRRRGLSDEGPVSPEFARAVLLEAPESWREETETVAVRGDRLGLTRERFRDSDEADRPIAVETLMLTEVNDDELISHAVNFDPDDIDGAMAELTARWIASGEVAHPEVIEAQRRLLDLANHHDWDTFAIRSAGATYVGHRQLAVGDTIADYVSSIRMLASLIPDLWLAPVEILSHSALGVVTYLVVKGTSTEGSPIELPLVILVLFDGDRVSRVETFDPAQRDLALARFQELSQSS